LHKPSPPSPSRTRAAGSIIVDMPYNDSRTALILSVASAR
jgi:hypothetical protein